MANTLPESALITTSQLIGFIMYIIIFTPMMFIRPSRMQPILFASFFMVATTIFGIFVWTVASNGGAPVPAPLKSISSSERSQSDWTRYAKTRRAPVLNQLFGAPLTITICATLGVFATSAVKQMYGKAIWNPISLFEFLLSDNYNAATRAGCFFAGLGWASSTNLVQNSVAASMDLASMAPKWIDVSRGGLLMCVIGYVTNPWRFVNGPGTFIVVLNSFGMFVSPLAGINIIRKLNWKVPDLYVGNKSSIYWFTGGLNWRAFLAWTLAIWASFPGFIHATAGTEVALGWTRTFQVTWIVGFMGGGAMYWLICTISPPPGAPYVTDCMDENITVEGVAPRTIDYENKSGASSAQVVDEEMGKKA
ncbi:uncharacterized protein BDZ99DRAFT_489152 [Mytilinidion resinicola]|uniref:Allantoin permease n=1 Tax=Mytilinidion resinicola TaxID=574789 RepID=A0A6A6YI81_9PEZI|nr:uncharacterized protein BDZ99DRAFT_489152 [Mytilinidion resinicola]KAF2808490.1 hypothetical protein BDZ99DRAFT_489152 [Mytilinidion resinicola]